MSRLRSAWAVVIAAAGAAGLLAGCVVAGPPYGGPPVVVAPPPVTVTPRLVVIPGTPVSYAANWPDDLFFYEGRYYRQYRGSWYWSVSAGSGWIQIGVGQVPAVVVHVPPGYRKQRGRHHDRQRRDHDDDDDDEED